MAIMAICQSCGRRFQAPDAFAGKRVKCKGCGQVFAVPGLSDAADEPDLALLAAVESSAAPVPPPVVKVAAPANTAATARGGPPGEKTAVPRPALARPSGSGEEPDDDSAEPASSGRANYLTFRYPGAQVVDQWLPLILLLAGLGWLALLDSGDETYGAPWIKLTRFLVPVIFYRAIIFPFTYARICRAGLISGFNMPPNPKMRAFAAYLPALAFSTALWVLGEGSVSGLLVGAGFGLALSSVLLWLLFRLQEQEVSTAVSYAAYGFGTGTAIAVGMVVLLNFVSALATRQAKAEAKVPVSPYAVALYWPPLPPAQAPGPVQVVHHTKARPLATEPSAHVRPQSPVLSDLHVLPVPGKIVGVMDPFSPGPVVPILRASGDPNAPEVVAWDVRSDQLLGPAVRLTGQVGPAVPSLDGRSVARIVSWPRRSIHVESLVNGKLLSKVDLDPELKDPVLIGFSGPQRLLVRGTTGGPTVMVLNLADPADLKLFALPAMDEAGVTLTVCTATGRMAVATRTDGVPTVAQFDLTTGRPLPLRIPISIERTLPVTPTGFTYSADGKRLGMLFEHEGSAALLSFDAETGSNTSELDFPGPGGIVPVTAPGSAAAGHAAFKGNALASVDPLAWLVYGQSIVNAQTGDVLASLMVDGVVSQRVLSDQRIELLTVDGSGVQTVAIATLDDAKLKALLHPQPTTAP